RDQAAGQGDDRLDGLLVLAVVEDREGLAVRGGAAVAIVIEHRRLGRLVQPDRHEADLGPEVALLPQELRGPPDLVRAQRLERVAGDGLYVRALDCHGHSSRSSYPGWE